MLCCDYTQLAEPNLLIPGKKPLRSAVALSPYIARGLCGLVVPVHLAEMSHDLLGNELTVVTSGQEGLELVHVDGTPMVRSYELVGNSMSGYASADIANRIESGDDVTVLTSLQINDLDADQGLFGFGSAQWSWLDRDGAGNLRVSAYTQYDTITPITAVGRHTVGLIWRADNSYQTIVNGKFSKSGTSSRQAFSGDCAIWCATSFTDKGLLSVHNAYGDWWSIWNRSLSEPECAAACSRFNQIAMAA